jgi:hypothetical protein
VLADGAVVGRILKVHAAPLSLVDLVTDGLATAHSRRVIVARRTVEIMHVKITEAGRRALHRAMTQKRRLVSRRVRRK